jgi:oligoendopeptidase F
MNGKIIPPRKDIPKKDTWNHESVFADLQAWEAEYLAIQADTKSFQNYQSTFRQSPTQLADALEQRDDLTQRLMMVLMYALISHEVDKTDSKATMLPGKAYGLAAQVQSATAFLEPGILALGEEKILEWLQDKARLIIYTHYLKDLFRKQAHVRSAEVEELLGMLADPFSNTSNTAGMLTDADMKFPPAVDSQGQEHQITQGSLPGILSLADREARRTAWENYTDGHLAYKNTLASNLITSMKQNVFTMRTRRFPNTLEASLFENDIPTAVFYNLIETFRKNLPTWQRYFRIRKKALGVEKLYPYDMWAPLTKDKAQISFPQAVDWICQGLAPMGSDYVETVRKGCLEQRWVDIYPNQGKTAGAFSFGTKGSYPFIVMNYTGEIFSLSTLAHELGHSMHSYLTWENQPVAYSDYSLFVAEVASNFHQAMVRSYLLNHNPDPAFQIGIIEEAMANFYRYFLIMPTLARFELETHQRIERGEGLNAEGMNDIMADLFQEVYGDNVEVDRQRVGITWATFGHLYQDYYVYQYATGISAAHALSAPILDGAPGAVNRYLDFLKSGSSDYPLNVLRKAGVDLTSPQPVEQTFDILASMVDRLESLL